MHAVRKLTTIYKIKLSTQAHTPNREQGIPTIFSHTNLPVQHQLRNTNTTNYQIFFKTSLTDIILPLSSYKTSFTTSHEITQLDQYANNPLV